MMKYIKTYEDVNNEPQIGDYVLCKQNEGFAKKSINNIISKNIGKILSKFVDYYIVYYDCFIPEKLKYFFSNFNGPKYSRLIKKYEIEHFSSNKEDLEILLKLKKYNL